MQHKIKLLNKEENWHRLRNYKPNDTVNHNNKLWQNVTGLNSEPNDISRDWINIDYANINYVNNEIDKIKEFATTGIVGSINPEIDTTSLPSGVYYVQTSGTYTNASNIVVKEGYYTLLRKKDDGSWVLESEVKIPMQDLTKIETELESTQTKVDEFIRDFAVTLDEENNPKSALSYAKGNDVLKGFFDQTINGGEIKFSTTQGFLYTNNTVRATNEYPVSFSKNIPVKGNFLVTGVVLDPINNVASLLGIKGSVVTNLVKGLSDGAKYAVNVSSSDYDFISTGFLDITPTKIYDEGTSIGNIDAKNYIDERLIVLDSFLNPTHEEIEEISIPQAIEFSGLFITNNWTKYTSEYAFVGDIPISELEGFDRIRIEGDFKMFGDGAMFLGGFKNTTPVKYDVLLTGISANSNVFEIDINHNYEGYTYSRSSATKFFKIKKAKTLIEKDSVLKAIESGVGTGSKISQQTKAKIAYPTNLIELNFETSDNLPTAKGTLAKGVLNYTDNAGTSFKKFATLGVQGSSSAFHPKKNWTFALFNDEAKEEEFKLRIGNWAYHSEFVFKSNWIDATHCRNILSNKIWEDIVQSRKYFPKRENEVAYLASNTNVDQRFDSGALCHVDGMPAKLFVNGGFYGIGMFNLGKKRENYDLKSSNQNHIQLAAETHTNFNSYVAEQWEIRNPKTPDANFQNKINAWFASNALTGQAFKDNFETNHVLKNAIDFFLLAEFIQSPDMYTKNLMLTSWDGVKFYFLPYDMDTTFGLQWDGLSFTGHTVSIRETSFWSKFYNAYSVEIKARYKELRDSGVFTLENVYKHADKMNKTFGLDSFEEEFACWNVPSNSTIYTSYPQIYQWVKDRLIWLDSQYL